MENSNITINYQDATKELPYGAGKDAKVIKLFGDKQNNSNSEREQMIKRLQAATGIGEFTLFYQPEYNIITNEIIGVEALARWFHPVEGFISPEIFIPLAEKSNRIYDLERWIFHKALLQKMEWEKVGLDQIELSINLSSKTLESDLDFQKIEKIISLYDIDYSKVIVEITETVIISNIELARERLYRLKKLGIRIALDDFGTGYSSLVNLLKLPIDIIKIDKSFIKAVPYGKYETIITKNVISMAHELNCPVVAEGIETKEQMEFLQKNSCDRGQGYYMCTPLSVEKVNDMLIGNRQKSIS